MLDTKDIEILAKLFAEFPGIGERQSKRFVYYLLRRGSTYRDSLIRSIKQLEESVAQCESCFRFFSNTGTQYCEICSNKNRDISLLMIVEKDSDIDAIEKSRAYKGKYFILGGLIPIATEDKVKHIRIDSLLKRLTQDKDILKEIILGLPVHPNGDYTTDYIKHTIGESLGKQDYRISILGRGLSTGTDIEYTDQATITYALQSRQ